MKKVIFLNDGIFHPPLPARRLLKKVFGKVGYDILAMRSFEELPDLDLAPVAAIIIYVHHKSISKAALDTFEGFVKEGGGVLGIHTATASFKEAPRYYEILGGRFTGHGPISSFTIEPLSEPNEPFDGLLSFTITDELYLHEFSPDIRVHFTALHAGLPQPMVWTHAYGTGKVCCVVPGHLLQTVHNEIYQELLIRGLEWVSR